MPEQITKYPDVTLKVLKEAGATCGEGAPQKILTQCPRERFCALPSGELCIYGIEQIPQMTQIRVEEIAAVLQAESARRNAGSNDISTIEGIAVGAVFLAGVALGRFWPKARPGKRD